MSRRLVLLGPPGAGKGTLGSRLATALSVPLVVTGDLMRETSQKGDALGLQIRSFVESGKLVPDDLVSQMIARALKHDNVASTGFILDGFPRTLPQAESLANFLEHEGCSLDAVLLLDIDEATAIERLALRRQCVRCGAIYHLRFSPPKNPDKCDKCGDSLIQRSDDHPDVIRRRLTVYREQTTPLIHYYEGRRLLSRINATMTPDEVFQAAMTAVNKLSRSSTGVGQ